MKMMKVLTLIACIGVLASAVFAAEDDKDNEGGKMDNIKTMDQAWKAAMEQFGDEQDDAKKAMDFYKDNFPEKIKYLEKELRDDPEEVVDELSEDLEECSEMLELKVDNPEEFRKRLEYMRLEVKTDLTGEKIQDLKDEDAAKNKDEIEKLSKELKEELGKLFDMKLQREKEELKNLEQDIEKLRQHIKQREVNKDKIIERKFNELIGVDEDLEF